ncbi:unnamed protein product [Lactuca virosa]|uniref:Uncharacterized protein n=1 Tax=Lactuca virosa TaxID=75947 RepID=A0AAU9MZN7_9ASTR|nr:unnamed protein product [Lactuca virosa]
MSRVICEHCILRVNIAKYRSIQVCRGSKISETTLLYLPLLTPRLGGDLRPFAEAVVGNVATPAPSTLHPIALKPAKALEKWDGCVLVSETINIQHIAKLPTILELKGNQTWLLVAIGKPLIRQLVAHARLQHTKHLLMVRFLSHSKKIHFRVFEYERDWTPFDNTIINSPAPHRSEHEENDEDNGDDVDSLDEDISEFYDDVVSATYVDIRRPTDVHEEGEIVDETGCDILKFRAKSVNGKFTVNLFVT